jgi:hypothetical protein
LRLVWSATYVNVKSWRSSAIASTADATSVEPKHAMSALRAESASRLRFWRAATAPATAA